MTPSSLAIFQNKTIRKIFSEDEWWFVLEDVVSALTDSSDPKQYVSRMKQRDPELKKGWVQFVHTLGIDTAGGKQRMNCVNTEGAFRIIQSIPSSKAEPFKLWLAKVGHERVQEIEDPELGINRALNNYLVKGYSEDWINQRLKTIEIRKQLTDEWKKGGVLDREYGILTDEITRAWAGISTKEYKNIKGLKKENLRDNMSNLELILNMLAEATTTEIAKKEKPIGLDQNKKVAKKGGEIAGKARKEIERNTGKSVINRENNLKLR